MIVLIVEGDKLQAEMYKDGYELAGHSVLLASGAQEAVSKLDKEKVDLILLNLILPGRSGVEVLHELNSYDDWRQIPVVLITDNHPSTFKIKSGDLSKYSVKEMLFKQELTPREVVDKSVQLLAK